MERMAIVVCGVVLRDDGEVEFHSHRGKAKRFRYNHELETWEFRTELDTVDEEREKDDLG